MTQLGIPPHEHAVLIERLLTLLTSCDERRYEQWEQAELVGLHRRRAALGGVPKFLAEGLTRTLVAARGARDQRPHRRPDPRPDRLRPHARRRPRRPRARRPDQRGVDRPVGRAPATASASTCGSSSPVQGLTVRDGRIAGVTTPAGTVTADHYVAALPVEIMRQLAGPPLRALDPALRAARPARHALDERRPLLPRPRRAARARPRDLHRLRVGADLDLAGPVLEGASTSRATATGASKGILSIDVSDWDDARPPDRQGRDALLARGDPRRGLGPARRPPQRRPRAGARRAARARLVPRPRDRVPEPDRGRQPRAAADQHRRLVGRPPGRRRRGSRTCCWPPTTCAPTPTSRRWRAPTRRRAARSTRSSTAPARRRRAATIYTLPEPAVLRPARTLDELRWRLFHRPAKPRLQVTGDGGLEPAGLVSRALLGLGSLTRRLGR